MSGLYAQIGHDQCATTFYQNTILRIPPLQRGTKGDLLYRHNILEQQPLTTTRIGLPLSKGDNLADLFQGSPADTSWRVESFSPSKGNPPCPPLQRGNLAAVFLGIAADTAIVSGLYAQIGHDQCATTFYQNTILRIPPLQRGTKGDLLYRHNILEQQPLTTTRIGLPLSKGDNLADLFQGSTADTSWSVESFSPSKGNPPCPPLQRGNLAAVFLGIAADTAIVSGLYAQIGHDKCATTFTKTPSFEFPLCKGGPRGDLLYRPISNRNPTNDLHQQQHRIPTIQLVEILAVLSQGSPADTGGVSGFFPKPGKSPLPPFTKGGI